MSKKNDKVNINPFIPYQPIDPNRFIGRSKEIAELEDALSHAKGGYPRHFLITGDRGIGKTSFFDYIRKTARSYSETQSLSFNFIVVDVVIDKSTTRLDLVRKIKKSINYELAKTEPAKDYLEKVWGFVQRIEAMGFSLKPTKEEEGDYNILYDDLGYSLVDIINKICVESDVDPVFSGKAYDGILILLDEADQASASLGLGSFIKYLLEFLHRYHRNKVVFGLAGLPSVIDVLLDSHRSSLRLFDELPLPCLQYNEVMALLDSILIDAQDSEKKKSITIEDAARKKIWEFSDGHPQFCHQIGYCAFEIANAIAREENMEEIELKESHVIRGALNNRGAFDIIGDVYFRDVYEKVSESNYVKEILRYVIENNGHYISYEDFIKNQFVDKNEAKTALELLEKSGLLFFDTRRNEYKLKYSCFAYWFGSKYPGIIL